MMASGLFDLWQMDGFDAHVKKVKSFYKSQRDLMSSALDKHLTGKKLSTSTTVTKTLRAIVIKSLFSIDFNSTAPFLPSVVEWLALVMSRLID